MKILLNVLMIVIIGILAGSQPLLSRDNNMCIIENELVMQVAQADDDIHHGKWQDKEDREGRKKFEKFREGKLIKLLELSDEQKEKVLPLLEHNREDLFRLIKDKEVLTEKLAYELRKKKPIDEHVRALSGQIMELIGKQSQLHEKIFRDVTVYLTPVQVGKLIIFEERFHQRAMRQLFERGGKGGPMPPHGKMGDEPEYQRERLKL